MAKYSEGTIIQRRNRYRFIKTSEGLRAEHRVIAESKMLNRELYKNERVFHLDCDHVDDNSPENLVVIKYRTNPFRPLPESRVIYIPKRVMV